MGTNKVGPFISSSPGRVELFFMSVAAGVSGDGSFKDTAIGTVSWYMPLKSPKRK
jgi:hypothetical protein